MFPTEGRMQWRIFCTNFLLFQKPFCPIDKHIEAAKQIRNSSGCLKQCSGLMVTSYDKYEMDNSDSNDIDIIKKLSEDYWNYKGYFTFPEMYKGILTIIVSYQK